ncbi:hypothetical protein [Actinacidiphila oryziradicis]|uniref:Uncharacterized protein n=1 Tax=Actinacidiphila oryziradicis TaxID=2571141 RepID=A0A4U0SFD4_9ACTN|nr:hypothetical protein [Actinacidiphila oryziradicis]TJZ98994.1 hypothetical protein FCI23_47365 [Actinacidiphila oryziradicis]
MATLHTTEQIRRPLTLEHDSVMDVYRAASTSTRMARTDQVHRTVGELLDFVRDLGEPHHADGCKTAAALAALKAYGPGRT